MGNIKVRFNMDDIWQHGGFGENDRKKKIKSKERRGYAVEIARARMNETKTDIYRT